MEASPLQAALAAAWPPDRWRGVSVLVAVSGGPDSVALLRAVLQTARQVPGPGRILAGHFNHRLRPGADRDEEFVRALCQQFGVPLEVGHASRESGEEKLASEAAARSARYEFLQAAAQRLGARYVALAHTADDQAETILHRIVRGTGLAGLAGIPFARSLGPAATLVRPLLNVSRWEVLAYLEQLAQDYCHDETNLSTRFTRNRIRHELLPLLEADYNPAVRQALRRLGELAADAQGVIESQAAELVQQHVLASSSAEVTIDCTALGKAPPHLLCEMFVLIWKQKSWPQQGMQREHWQRLAAAAGDAAQAEPLAAELRFQLPAGIEVRRGGNLLRLTAGS